MKRLFFSQKTITNRKFRVRENMWWARTSSDFFRDRMAKTHSMLLSSWIILKRSSLMYLSFPTDIRLTSSCRTHETWNKENVFVLFFLNHLKIQSKNCLLLVLGLLLWTFLLTFLTMNLASIRKWHIKWRPV